jgi:hypothetical protein
MGAEDPGMVAAGGPGPLFDSQAEACATTDPFGRSKVTPTAEERVMAGVIWRHQGRGNPILIATLQKILGKSERTVKGIKQQLIVTHKMRIGSQRGGGQAGYFMIADAVDLAVTVASYQGQVVEMWRVLRVLMEGHELRRLHGQLDLETKE